ncbi:MAG TPA: phosphoribosylformylglycinamidine cyclo-ligase [Spirochaetia bacterium]|nr:MAG: phosphoribosylformylglycinamidine cyclo-ligase [Spirochaetes bacterium GWB1_36_13]HCL56806.1 phosphoribosylformylglycinamidine cyclo-ligase [Spirochaetia bacterium]
MAVTYKDSGVDIEAGEKMVNEIKKEVATTFNKNVLSQIGLFGGFFKIPEGYKNPVLVSSVDGVGTKLKIAFMMDKHNTVGEDLVNHCVNDIAVCGAEPLYFLDYLATGKLKPEIGAEIVKGMARGCRNNGCALIGGETAEMPGFYNEGEYDMSGTIVGIVDQDKIIKGDDIQGREVLIGLPSNGLHTNGYSLARKVILDKYKANTYSAELGMSVGEELLKVHKSYLSSIKALKNSISVKGMSHITGGGIEGNTKRIIPEGKTLKIDWNSWEWLPIFKLIQKEGDVPLEDMRRTFNLGIGIIFAVDKNDLNQALKILKDAGENPLVVGEVI